MAAGEIILTVWAISAVLGALSLIIIVTLTSYFDRLLRRWF